ncbi:MAG: Wzz/FepE/Etk N-terminal domain-containing protein [Ruminococcus sp.]|nr:Wzz/FepE/Etk N-terminal domain-containing protein [Ruminococcus sp.]
MNEQEQTLDLQILFKVLRVRLIPIIAVMAAVGLAGFVLSAFVLQKQYTSEALLYVENSSNKNQEAININDISAAQKLVNTCQILFTSDYIFERLREEMGADWSNSEMENMIRVESRNNTEVLSISVTTASRELSVAVADKLVELSQEEYRRIIRNGSIELVSPPTYPLEHTFPSVRLFTAGGLAIGLLGSYLFFLLIEMLDTKVREDDDLAAIYEIPVFAEIMDFETADNSKYKSNYDYDYGYGESSYADEPEDEDEDT